MSEIKTAAAYIRVSTDDQVEYSPAAQLRELREYADANHIFLDDRYVYSDEGISGRRAEKRPGFMQMIADAKSAAHPFDVLLVHKFDRFARSREDSIVYKSMLKRSGVEVISIKEPLSDGSYSGVMEAIYESFAEAYSINLGQEVRKGMTEKARRGEPQTAPPFGYRLMDKAFVPHEEEAVIVRRIFERFSAGESFFAIAKWLNAQGVTTHRGNAFENRTVEYILRNPVYIGMLRWNPKRKSRRTYDDPDILTVQGQHQPIIDSALWDAVHSRMADVKARRRYHGRPGSDRKHWLCGILRCAACGATMIFTQPHYMKCNNYTKGRCLHSQFVAVDLLVDAFISQLQQDFLIGITLDYRVIRSANAAESQLQELRQALARAEKKRTRLTDAYLNEAIGMEEFKCFQSELDADIAQAREALAEAQTAQSTVDTLSMLRSAIEQTLYTLSSDASIAQKYEAVDTIIEHCIFDKATAQLSITYRSSI